jgi:hypothetical protein
MARLEDFSWRAWGVVRGVSGSPGEIRCRAEGLGRIKGVVGSSVQSVSGMRALPLVRGGSLRLVRAPGRRGAWSAEEVAYALSEQRGDLRRALDRRQDAAGVAAGVREEVVDEAIGLVVMVREPIRDERHMLGAFWCSVRFLLAEHRAGRHAVRVGSRRRVELDPLADRAADGSEPVALVAARERAAQAADWMVQLDSFERRVVAVMATRGVGVKLAARALGEPVKRVLAASRSAERKLERVARIAAAGRMCDYREPAILAHAQGTAHAQQERAARAHLAACAACRGAYARSLRDLPKGDFRRAASAAFLPAPAVAVHGHGWLGRLMSLLPEGRAPGSGGSAERAAGLLGGSATIKVVAASTALVIAGAGVGAHVVGSLDAPTHARHHHLTPRMRPSAARASARPVVVASAVEPRSVPVSPVTHRRAARRRAVAGNAERAPSRSLGYLALGESAGGHSSAAPRAQAASATSYRSSSSDEDPPPEPSSTGGGASLNYLGH